MQQIIEFIIRSMGGLILLFFAFAPAWVLFHLAQTILWDPGDLDLTAAIAFVICMPLLYFLLLLAFRAFTGRGRKQDGGLLPPWALKVFAVFFGMIAVAIAVYGMFQGEFRAILGGIGYLVPAVILYRVVKWRETNAHDA